MSNVKPAVFPAVVWQRVEGAIIFAAGILLFCHVNSAMPWWVALLVFFVPDLSMLAYLFGPRAGALAYNAVHIYGFGAALLAFGLTLSIPLLMMCGALALAHSGFDRMLGYGLKSAEGFFVTHLGRVGKQG